MKVADRNIELLRTVAERLGPLCHDVVFVGGAATGLLITDLAAPTPRPTKDVDVIVEVASLVEYSTRLRDQLVGLGFSEDTDEDAPLCRWVVAGVKVDIMPTAEGVLGFSNRWYATVVRHAVEQELPGGRRIRMASAPLFLATKLEAFRGRGHGDYQASHDIEDLIAVLDGRPGLEKEITSAPLDVRRYVAGAFRRLLDEAAFLDALPGHLPGDPASQARVRTIIARMEEMAAPARSTG